MENHGKSITITYGDCAENHNGMQIIGKMANNGFSIENLEMCKLKFESEGVECRMINLNDYAQLDNFNGQARVLVIKNGVNHLLKTIGKTADNMFVELVGQQWDTKALMKGKVVNKHARYNICIADTEQKANFVIGKGTIISFNKLECSNKIREVLPQYLDGSLNLVGEGNYYYDNTCGIGWHGDSERRKVVAVKLGNVKPLNFQWYHQGERIGRMCTIDLAHGDIYIMSELAVGTNWKIRKSPTLRHSTGATKYIS